MTATNLSPSLPTAAAPARSESSRHDQHLVHRLKATSTSSPAPLATTTTLQDSLQSTLPLPELAPQDAFQSSALLSGQTLPGEQTTGTLPQDPADMGEMNGLSHQLSNSSDDGISARRPTTPRSQTDPSSDTPSYFQQARPRNRSPYSRSHLRSQSGSATLTAPPMTRAHSLPTVMNSTGHLSLSPSPMPHARPASPLRSPKRTRSPRITPLLEPRISIPGQQYGAGLRSASVGSFEGAPSVCDISEDAELELTPKAGNGLSTMYSSTSSLSRRRRPASPLYQVSMSFGTPTSAPSVSTPTSTASSPLLNPAKFNEPFPGYSSSLASSSIPSTPTSMRSRSPSISSLETIPDSPDAEEEALEADRIARLKAAADREDGEEARRSSLDVPGDSRRSFGFGKRDSRKRWSVCGAERRGDLDLETIWED